MTLPSSILTYLPSFVNFFLSNQLLYCDIILNLKLIPLNLNYSTVFQKKNLNHIKGFLYLWTSVFLCRPSFLSLLWMNGVWIGWGMFFTSGIVCSEGLKGKETKRVIMMELNEHRNRSWHASPSFPLSPLHIPFFIWTTTSEYEVSCYSLKLKFKKKKINKDTKLFSLIWGHTLSW